jgi:hypothetical protein
VTEGEPASSAADGLSSPPPFWGRWSRLYWLVGGALLADVIAFWLLTRWAA